MSAPSEIWKDLAGPLYDQLVATKEQALALLFHADSNVRIAAISVCRSAWDCSSDPAFLNACQTLAANDANDTVRCHAIDSLGSALRSSRDPSASRFLAGIALDPVVSDNVRRAAYRALREIQFGLSEDDVIRRSIPLFRAAAERMPSQFSEEQIKGVLRAIGKSPETEYDQQHQIDWDFVRQFA